MKILVVEDVKFTRKTYIRSFAKIGYENLEEAGDGREALDIFKEAFESDEKFELIISDIFMPEMDGIELTKEIRKLDSDIPIILLTSETDTKVVSDAIEAGANAYLVKPFRSDALSAKIKEVTS